MDDWTLFEDDGGTWVRDLDLAERAGMGQPRNIRSKAIATAIKDGALADLKDIGSPTGRPNGTPGYRTEIETVISGKGNPPADPRR